MIRKKIKNTNRQESRVFSEQRVPRCIEALNAIEGARGVLLASCYFLCRTHPRATRIDRFDIELEELITLGPKSGQMQNSTPRRKRPRLRLQL
jgi:hypothetical protein